MLRPRGDGNAIAPYMKEDSLTYLEVLNLDRQHNPTVGTDD